MMVGVKVGTSAARVRVTVALVWPLLSVAVAANVSVPLGALVGTSTSKKTVTGLPGGEMVCVDVVVTAPLTAPLTSMTATSSVASTTKCTVSPGETTVPGAGAVIEAEGGSSGSKATLAAALP